MRGLGPTGAADDHQRLTRQLQHLQEFRHCAIVWCSLRDAHRRRIGHIGRAEEQVFRQGHHHRTHAARHRTGEGAADDFRNPLDGIDLGGPFGEAAEHLPIVHFLEALAAHRVGRHLTHEEDHRRGVLARGVHAIGSVCCARSAGHEGDARPTLELAVGIRHVRRCALMPRDDGADAGMLMQGIEHRQITLARHAVDRVNGVATQGLDEDLAAVANRFLKAWFCHVS